MKLRDVLRTVVVEELRRLQQDRPWMTAETAAAYLDFSHCVDPVAAFRKWVKTTRVVPSRRGDVPLYHRDDLDEAINARPIARMRRTG